MLIRALEPTAGLEAMRARRGGRADRDLCSGPGKLTEALGIGLDANGADLTREPFLLWRAREAGEVEIVSGPRIGITKATELPWRFCAAGNRFVSRPAPSRRPIRLNRGPLPPPVPPLTPPESGVGAAGAGVLRVPARLDSGSTPVRGRFRFSVQTVPCSGRM